MKIENIGKFRNEATGEIYDVLKYTKITPYKPLSGPKQDLEGSCYFTTKCGIDLKERDKDLNSFESNKINGIIKRVGEDL